MRHFGLRHSGTYQGGPSGFSLVARLRGILYNSASTLSDQYEVIFILSHIKDKALAIARVAVEKHAQDVQVLEVGALTSIADYFILGSGNSERQVKAIAEAIDQTLSHEFNARAKIEGGNAGLWILMDYGDIVVHIFRQDIREFYGIEKMWGDAPTIPPSAFEPASPASQTLGAASRTSVA